ncbi:mucin-2 [Streptomyces mirabilis]|uniref:mucin-2 n=1 Tax=Streptomyces mirabilis TaxID=68239 RepID=UPI0033EC12F8
MQTYATAENIGLRDTQCDATAVHTAPTGIRAYVLLDGIGSSQTVRNWTRTAARRVAHAAARLGDAEAGLQAVYNRYQAERTDVDRYARERLPKAAAIVAVTAPGRPITFAWCGDSRAYLGIRGRFTKVSNDHNLRRVHPARDGRSGGSRNIITSYLGSSYSDQEVKDHYGHPAIEARTLRAVPSRLVLASDGAYEPHLDAGYGLAAELAGNPRKAARRFVDSAVGRSIATSTAASPGRPYADNATVLVADILP